MFVIPCLAQTSCSIGDNVILPPSTTHHYFLRCRDYYTDDGSTSGKTTGCAEEVMAEGYSGNISMAQNCGASWNTFEVVQTSTPNTSCGDGFLTSLEVTFNGADVVQDRGCWMVLRGKAYQLGAQFICADDKSGPSDTCAQWLSLDGTNNAFIGASSWLWIPIVLLGICWVGY